MRDDFHGQAWADHHGQLSAAIHKVVHAIAESFEQLNDLQYDAPWRAKPRSGATRSH